MLAFRMVAGEKRGGGGQRAGTAQAGMDAGIGTFSVIEFVAHGGFVDD
jgi:hypothetical protein